MSSSILLASNFELFAVLFAGALYGDINDTNKEGEETLENIDYISLKVFPCLFLLFMIVFWATFLSGQIRY